MNANFSKLMKYDFLKCVNVALVTGSSKKVAGKTRKTAGAKEANLHEKRKLLNQIASNQKRLDSLRTTAVGFVGSRGS